MEVGVGEGKDDFKIGFEVLSHLARKSDLSSLPCSVDQIL